MCSPTGALQSRSLVGMAATIVSVEGFNMGRTCRSSLANLGPFPVCFQSLGPGSKLAPLEQTVGGLNSLYLLTYLFGQSR